MNIPLHYTPRAYQADALAALDAGCVINVWCWARRGGKDLTAFAYAARKMVEQPMNVVLIFPTKEQGKNAFWDNVENDGFKTIDHLPESLRDSTDNSNMRIRLKNGSTFQILGATEPDSLRGANAKLYIFSEFVDINSAALDVIRPVVAANGGQIILQSTPKIDGISGGTFKIIFDRAIKNMKDGKNTQYASLITAREYLSEEVLEELRQENIAKYGNDFFFRQEFLCDWGQASSTAYYAHILAQLRKKRGIGHFPHIAGYPVYTAWDLGTGDSTAIVFWQQIGKKTRIIDYYETHDMKYSTIINFVLGKSAYVYGWHFFPHDANVRDEELNTRIEKIRELGLANSSILKRESREGGIERVADGLPDTEINEATTIELIKKLILFKKKFNGLTGDYMGPEHKTESHAADATKYMFKAIAEEFDKETGAFFYAPENAQDEYEGESITVPGLR